MKRSTGSLYQCVKCTVPNIKTFINGEFGGNGGEEIAALPASGYCPGMRMYVLRKSVKPAN